MAYPDFLSSRAPDYVGMFLGILKNQNEMSNNSQRTVTDMQRAAADNWFKQVQAAKINQEVADDPRTQDRADALAQAQIAASGASTNRVNTMTPIEASGGDINNLIAAVKATQGLNSVNDQQLADQFKADYLKNIQPADVGTDKESALVNSYMGRAHDPQTIFAQKNAIYAGSPDYNAAAGLASLPPDKQFDIQQTLSGNDNPLAVLPAIKKQESDETREEKVGDIVDAQTAIAKAKGTAAQEKAGSTRDLNVARNYVATITRNNPAWLAVPTANRAAVAATIDQQIREAHQRNGGFVNPEDLTTAVNAALSGSTPQRWQQNRSVIFGK